METIDFTPTWKTAVSIYIEVLLCATDRYSTGVEAAREELNRLADTVDKLNNRNVADGEPEIDPDQLTLQF